MNTIVIASLFVLGAWVGRGLNRLADGLAYRRGDREAGSTPAKPARLSAAVKIPIIGWLWRRGEPIESRPARWFRPLLVELLAGLVFAGLYWWEVVEQGLLPSAQWTRQIFPSGAALDLPWTEATLRMLTRQYAAHLILICLMIVASLIDLDELTIPDEITIPGTLGALVLAALFPWILPPGAVTAEAGGTLVAFVTLSFPNEWPVVLGASPRLAGLGVGLGCFWGWSLALLPRFWYARRGLRKALAFFAAYLVRHSHPLTAVVMPLVGSAAIVVIWRLGGVAWAGLLTSLVGVAAGGALVWSVRLIAGGILRREAMGFGDVTLLAMIGGFLGWQACLIVFFLAPLAGMLVGVVQWVLHREQQLPYGPYLCLAAAVVIVAWPSWWGWLAPVYAVPWLAPVTMVLCMALMAPLLYLVQLVKWIFRRRSVS